jgi:hypothetical protein
MTPKRKRFAPLLHRLTPKELARCRWLFGILEVPHDRMVRSARENAA